MKTIISQNDLDWHVESAGTESYHIGEPPHQYSQKICQKFGIDITEQRARRFVVQDFKNFDKIYAMADDVMIAMKSMTGAAFDETKVSLFLNELYPGSNRSVPDPWYGPEDGYSEVFDMIHKTCKVIAEKYKNGQPHLCHSK